MHLAVHLERTANFGLAKKTWSSYRTGQKMLLKCQQETGISMEVPLVEENILVFVAWLIEKNLSSSTIDTYLGSLRLKYLQEGLDPSPIRSELIKQIIRGRKNETLSVNTAGECSFRLPVTPTVLKLLKMYIKKQSFDKPKKLMLWAICTICFFGSFRISEILCRNKTSFDPLNSLLSCDVKLVKTKLNDERVSVLQIQLKQEKTRSNPTPTTIDVFETNSSLCPVSAFLKWKKTSQLSVGELPAFRTEDGRQFSTADFNSFLKEFNEVQFPEAPGRISSHSFRAGLPSILGSLGYADKDIQSLGRWTSSAFSAYVKLPRARRLKLAREISSLNL